MVCIKTIPDETYRLQFNSQFTFRQATALIPYLHRLGISHCYASPYLKARPGKKALQNKLLIPVLGDHYGNILERRELRLKFDADSGEFSVYYYHHRFPIDPRTYPLILNARHTQLLKIFNPADPLLLEYQTLDSSFRKLPDRTTATPAHREERNHDKEVFKRQLARLCREKASIWQFIDSRVAEINDRTDDAADTDKLHILLEQQAYRRVAGDEINYRRFFDINDLAGLRVEEERVFNASHQFILALIEQGKIQGLCLDHADGLYDPVAYNQRLNERIKAIVHAYTDSTAPPIYIIAEKIIANYEYLSRDWPIHGTIGYEFANAVNGLFVNAEAEKQFTAIYKRFVGRCIDFEELVYQAKKLVMPAALAAEWNVLANRLSQIAEAQSKTRDYTLNALRDELLVAACHAELIHA